jgi:hypothetical protein
MGRRDRERKARIERGEEKSISQQARETAAKLASNPLGRRILRRTAHKGVVEELSQGTTVDQIQRLDGMAGAGEIPTGAIGKAIKKKAPGEMDKGIKKLKKEGKPVTVDTLCAEIKSTPGFLDMCNREGITLEWFENLARERMKAHGIEEV